MVRLEMVFSPHPMLRWKKEKKKKKKTFLGGRKSKILKNLLKTKTKTAGSDTVLSYLCYVGGGEKTIRQCQL